MGTLRTETGWYERRTDKCGNCGRVKSEHIRNGANLACPRKHEGEETFWRWIPQKWGDKFNRVIKRTYEDMHKATSYECDCGEKILGFDNFQEHIKIHFNNMKEEK